MWSFSSALVACLTPHLFMDPQQGRRYVQRWKPNFVMQQLVSKTSLNAYSRAYIQLGDEHCVGLLCNQRDAAYIIHRIDGTDCIVACLWPAGEPILEEFEALREWCETLNVTRLSGRQLTEQAERDLWMLSSYRGES